jgi:hypothetical protein
LGVVEAVEVGLALAAHKSLAVAVAVVEPVLLTSG